MTEPRLIDANAMRKDWLENGENEYVYDTNAVLDSIDAQPTVDAVPVVRCKECIYRQELGVIGRTICDHNKGLMSTELKDTDFCPYGERRTDGKD